MSNIMVVFAVVFTYGLIACLLVLASVVMVKVFCPQYDKHNSNKIPPIHIYNSNGVKDPETKKNSRKLHGL